MNKITLNKINLNKIILTSWNTFLSVKVICLKYLCRYKQIIIILIIAYAVADLLIISLRPVFISSKVVLSPVLQKFNKHISIAEYRSIWAFNIFHNGVIPPSYASIKKVKEIKNMPAVLSNLPFKLNGVIVYQDPINSVAIVTLDRTKLSDSYRLHDVIDSLARITNITSDKLYFINLNSQQEEYIEVFNIHNKQFKLFTPAVTPAPVLSKSSANPYTGIKKVGDFKFKMSRSDMNKYMRQLGSILKDARVVPHWENGKMTGYRFQSIKKGSIYEKFDFKVSDVIVSVAGEKPHSQLHAAELFHRLRAQSRVDIIVKRKAKNIAFSLDFTEDVSIEEPPESRFY